MRKIDKGWDGKFADPEVGRVLKLKGLIADANKSSIEELATIKTLNPNNSNTGSYFYNNTKITQFPELKYCTGLSSLYGAFRGCSNLTEVGNIPEGVTDLYSTFYGCSNLTETPIIPDSVTNMNRTFYGCSNLDGIFIIKRVTPPTYSGTFTNTKVVTIYVPDESVSRYKSARGWSDQSSKIFPMSYMEGDIFFEDPEVGRVLKLKNVIADANRTSIEELERITGLAYVFKDNKIITKFPELKYCTRVTNMNYAFYGCSNLTETPIIPDSVTSLSYTFYGCSNLTETPIIPDSVKSLYYTFYGCRNLIEAPIIPEGVTDMDYTFYGCSNLTEAPIIPDSVRYLTYTFYGCSNLDGIFIIPDLVTSLTYTFYGCRNLIEAPIIPEGVTSMINTFRDCKGLSGNIIILRVTPPSTYMDSPPTYTNPFSGTSVSRIYVPDESVSRYKSANGWSGHSSKIFPMSELPE